MPTMGEDGLPERIFDDPREMHSAICKHVEETRHVIISADSAERRLIGFKCGCRQWWASPVNSFRTLPVADYMRAATRSFQAKQQWAAILNESRRKTAWEHLNDAGDDE